MCKNQARELAELAGEKRYSKESPCITCGTNERYVATDRCIECHKSWKNRKPQVRRYDPLEASDAHLVIALYSDDMDISTIAAKFNCRRAEVTKMLIAEGVCNAKTHRRINAQES